MPDNSITPPTRMDPVSQGNPVMQAAQQPATPVDQSRRPQVEEVAKPAETALPVTNAHSNVFLKFRVDEKTNDLTVFVIDRASRQVLRTIPSDELTHMHSGDLLKLLA